MLSRLGALFFRSPLGWVIALLVARGVLVLSLAEVFFHGEELEKGTVAKAILDGLPIEHHRLAYHYYEGGGFVISHAKALAFIVAGENVIAHKLVALVTCVLVLVAGWKLCSRHFGPRAAAFFGLAYVLAPACWQKLGILSLGIHYEASFFVLVLLDICLRWLAEDRAPRRGEALAFGLAGGFGLYFSYQVALPLAFAVLALLLRRPRQFATKEALLALAAFVAGASPLAVMYALVGREVLDVHGAVLGAGSGTAVRVREFFASLYAPPSVASLSWPLLFGASLAGVGAMSRERRSRAAWLLAFLAFWLVVYSQSAFVVGRVIAPFSLMRFAPPWVVAWVLLAAGIASAWESGRAPLRATARIALGGLALLGGWSTLSILRAASPGDLGANARLLARTKGYDYAGWFAKVWDHLEGGDEERLRALAAFDEPEPALLWPDLASVAWQKSAERELLLERLRAVSGGRLEDVGAGLGALAAARGAERSGRRDLASALAATREFPAPLDTALERALGRASLDWAITPDAIARETAAAQTAGAGDAYFEGLGERIWHWLVMTPYGGGGYALRPERALQFIDTLPAPVVPAVRRGFERGRTQASL